MYVCTTCMSCMYHYNYAYMYNHRTAVCIIFEASFIIFYSLVCVVTTFCSHHTLLGEPKPLPCFGDALPPRASVRFR